MADEPTPDSTPGAPSPVASPPPGGESADAPGASGGAGGSPRPGAVIGGVRYPSAPPSQWPRWAPAGDASAPPPAPDPVAADRRRRRLAVVLASIVLLATVVAVALLVDRNDDPEPRASGPDSTAGPGSGPTTPDPSAPVDPSSPSDPSTPDLSIPEGPPVSSRSLTEAVPDIIEFVERTRGHEFKTTPRVEALDDEAFVAALRRAQAPDEGGLRTEQVAARALGLIEPDTDLVRISRLAADAGVLGFYDPESEELLVKGDEITPYVETVIAHELTHALDDQYFDLSRLDELQEQPDESAFGFLALVEGTARWVENAYRAQLPPDQQQSIVSEEMRLGLEQTALLAQVPIPYLVELQVPYATGSSLVDSITNEGGIPALDEAYERPPVTSEQVLDPAAFRRREPAVDLEEPEARETPTDTGAIGEVDLRILEILADPVGAVDSLDGSIEPIEGFGGGRFVSWTEAGRSCIKLAVVGDTDAGSVAISRLLREWAVAVGGVNVAAGVGPNGQLQIDATRCA